MKKKSLLKIEISGMPRERGRIHGEIAKPIIAKMIEKWRAELGKFGQHKMLANPISPDKYLHEFFSQTSYLNSIERWTPDLLEEVRGIAEGSDQAFENILGLQLMDEEWVFGLRHQLDRPTTKCTAFGVPEQINDISYSGQNMDIGSWVNGGQILLRVMPKENSPEALVFSIAGQIGLNGLNAAGLGVTCNTLAQLNYAVDGLPVIFIIRALLEKNSIDKAERFLRSIKHASGQNYILSSAGDMRCFECCGTSVIRYHPASLNGRVFHTNHPLVNKDKSADELTSSTVVNSKSRLDSICNRLGDVSKLLTLDDIKEALSAHDDPDNPVSRNTNKEGSPIGFTAGSSIYELDGVPRLHLASGPPCETAFEVFDFTTL